MRRRMTRRFLVRAVGPAVVLLGVLGVAGAQRPAAQSPPTEPGRFLWHDLMSRDVAAAKRFYGSLLGWRFEDTRRGDRPYVVATLAGTPVAGIVDVTAIDGAVPQWLSFMSVSDLDQSLSLVRSEGGKVLVEPRELERFGRAAVVADAQGAPIGFAQLRADRPESPQSAGRFFWMEYLARDASQALQFYKRLAGYDSRISDSRLNVEYHVLSRSRPRAGLFQLPETVAGVEPNWLPYMLVEDTASLASRAAQLGGRVVVPVSPDRRNGSLAVVADAEGAVLALQKYPF